MNTLWKTWARALGEKAGDNNRHSDSIAFIRTLLILQAIMTNIMIVVNILRKW